MAMDSNYLTTQVSTIIGQLHGIFDDIGIPSHEQEARESELFSALSETLHNHLRVVNAEKSEMTEEAQKLIKTIKQMEASLDDAQTNGRYDVGHDDLRVTYPLNQCLTGLKEKYHTVSKLHRERFEQVKKLVEALESYSSHLDPSFVSIPLPPTAPGSSIPPSFDLSPTYVTALDNEFTRVYEEYTRRVSVVKTVSEEIIQLWAELGTPQAQTNSEIVQNYRDSPEQLGLHESDLASLKGRREKLIEEKKGRERKLRDLKAAVEGLWDRLGVEEPDRKGFLAANRGCGLRTINEFEDELARLNELKKQNLHLFVEDARCRLQELWDALYYSEEEMLDFAPAFSDVYSDALLSAHESEIERLETLKEQRAPTLQLIDRHRTLVNDRDSLNASSQDASRLMARGNSGQKRDPTRLLREEKMRKRIAKELPKVEADLRKELERWEDEYGRPFLVHGERYLDEIAPAASKVPPRSKTPSGPPKNNRPNSAKQPASNNRNNETARGIPPRSATKTPTGAGTMRRNPPANATKSPSKIPSRVPLSNMPHGNNSPERRPPPQQPSSYSSNTVRGKMGPPPARAPPPKMRDLGAPPPVQRSETPNSNGYNAPPPRCISAMSGENIRPISPEDVYDDRNHRSIMNNSSLHHHHDINQSFQSFQSSMGQDRGYYHHQQKPYMQQPPQQQYAQAPYNHPAPRQISNTSTINTVTSGSENWETYDDNSDTEPDATEIYYAKLRAAQAAQGKRFGSEDPYGHSSSAGKKTKGIRGVGMEERLVEQDGRMVRVTESDGWTDEMETY
ncbi:hypothetical protein FQN54_003216 [Arachnomyces sp. PD_36]|nr:hypothetical protein FQN54_003216 [Arachnomyces sp. PD_36]